MRSLRFTLPLASCLAFLAGPSAFAAEATGCGAVEMVGLEQIERALAAKCPCGSPADCTCKKGQCQCGSCGGTRRIRLVAPLDAVEDVTVIPEDARYDATAGVFI